MKQTKKIQAEMRKFERALTKFVEDLVSEGVAGGRLERQILEFIRGWHLENKVGAWFSEGALKIAESAKAAAEAKYFWISSHIFSPEKNAATLGILRTAQNGFAKIAGQIEKDVVREVLSGIRSGDKVSFIRDRLRAKLGKARGQAYTIANTGVAAYDRTTTALYAAEAGITNYKYVGPSAQRDFCKRHLGKVYSEAEIAKMSNGQGLDVMNYGGGYNCRHGWEAVIEKAAQTMTPAARKAIYEQLTKHLTK